MASLRNTWKEKLVPALATLLGGLFTCLMTIAIASHSHFATPIDAICRELFTGSTVGRQALVGNLWFAPLPTLIHLPIAALLPAKGTFSAPFATLLLCHGVTVWLLWRFLRRHASRWIALALYAVTLGIYSAFFGSFEAPFHLSWSITGALAFYVIFKLADWGVTRRLQDWVLFSLALASLSLCGIRSLGWCALLAILLPFLIISDKRSRPRLGGLLFLCYLPLLYALGSWLLMSRLVLGKAFYAWRFFSGFSFGTEALGVPLWIAVTLCVLAVVLYWIRRLRFVSIAAACIALAFLWSSFLSSVGLGWAAPTCSLSKQVEQTYRSSMMTLLQDVGKDVQKETPYGRVFICGYEGLGLPAFVGETAFTPCLDLYINELRTAYAGQQLYLLVPVPEGSKVTHSCVWRYDRLYENGAEHLLYAKDYGSWRLYQVVSAPLASELEESEP